MVKRGAQAFGLGDVRRAELAPFLVVPEDRVLQLVAVILDQRADNLEVLVVFGYPSRFTSLGAVSACWFACVSSGFL